MNKAPAVNLLRARRAGLGFSQTDVGAYLDRTASWYGLIENGHYEPTPSEQAKIAEFLQCEVADIFPEKAA